MKNFFSKSLSVLVFFWFFMISCESNKSIDYQNTKKNPVVDSYFGTEVIDNYRWLEDDMSKETENWVTKQNETTFDYLNEISLREQL
ncbi:MAG: S9 family peptidase, partial [Flavobacteriaceae bacterium]|nr:S9 family peptidase [Flavobacteriaceae bacterium]